MPVAFLPERACLGLTGPDLRPFLQGLITQDIAVLDQAPALYAAMLTPQGKYLYDFFLVNDSDRLLLDGERATLPDLIKRLTMYKLRAKVDIADLSASHRLLAGWGDAAMPAGAFADPRLPALGWRLIAGADATIPANASAEDYDAHRLALGVPDASRDIERDKTLILEANIDVLNGVSFAKGCYVGQELTARMKHRGNIRRRLTPVRIDGATPPPGTELMANGKAVGSLRSARGEQGIAMIRLEDLDKAPFDADGARVTPVMPDWLATVI